MRLLKILKLEQSTEHLRRTIQTEILMLERLVKRRKTIARTNNYMDCPFILGSVAEVERIWSIPRYDLTQQRRAMAPELFEAIMFSRLNECFWDANLVPEAQCGGEFFSVEETP